MKQLKNLSTERLMGYCTLLEKFGAMCNEMIAFANDGIKRRILLKKDFDAIMEEIVAAAEKNDKLLVLVQQEIDERLKTDLLTKNGIVFFTNLMERFNTTMEEAQKKNQGTVPLTIIPGQS